MEKAVQQVKVEKNLSFTKARKQEKHAAMDNVSTTNIAIQTNLTWTKDEK